jgi:hypothetical protein
MEANQTPSNKFNNLVSRAMLAGMKVDFEAKVLDGSEWYTAFISIPGGRPSEYMFISAYRFTFNTKAKAFKMRGTRWYGSTTSTEVRPSDLAFFLNMFIQQYQGA